LLSCIQYAFGDIEISFLSFYLPIKFIIIGLYFSALGDFGRGEKKFIILMMMAPLLISSGAYVSEDFNTFMMQLWGVDPSLTWRFGGIYGADVNTLGMCSTLSLISLVVAYH
jgi:ABC-type Fe3+-siderophore transport system permease subunit